jgi:transposase-like protein
MANIKTPRSLQEAIAYFADPERAFVYAVNLRWPNRNVTCPRCGGEEHSFIRTRLLWWCKGCKKQFTVKVGTIFEDSPLGMDKWMTAFWMVVNCKNGVSSAEMARTLNITQKSAWFMLHRIREVVKSKSVGKLGSTGGAVESDETFVGPNPYRMHKSRKLKLQQIRGQQRRGDVGIGKTAVAGILDRETRRVRAKVVPNVRRETLQNAILNSISPGSKLYTDDSSTYKWAAGESEFIHEVVNHAREYVRGQVHTQGIDNFWSLLKRTLRGTYVAVEPFHLDRYLDEQIFRFDNRATKDNPLNDSDRFAFLMSQVAGKRLTYAQLTGKGTDSLHHETAGTGQEEPF